MVIVLKAMKQSNKEEQVKQDAGTGSECGSGRGLGIHGTDGLGLQPRARTWLYASGEWQTPGTFHSSLKELSHPPALKSTAYGCSQNGLVPLTSLQFSLRPDGQLALNTVI